MIPTNILTAIDKDEIPLAEEINTLSVLKTTQTANFVTYNVFIRRILIWHMNEGVTIEKILDEN